ncbi:hypothetical protein LEN26_010762 [Aphanomyces euteiches]|uniref:Signal peptidase complex subunit 1 n=1 Tax=Aphanomyces euteiches TaxID=100861 RepID=A0A6G0XBE7_9STRA|nr:hypothetical protein Ae201684_006458 [Aphanomyces euteiches]KAH9090739.1 hypothetical protein Ae201684P_006145 [Aphanomyces euteiches]KAH9109073.1 hypothetical protein AeMF1_015814 [Aphanomyces euteiches]KAH9121282.1 hypothetical protein LEN26_010762 [Aphanomyces euteiches]KAH9145322.1 hypothetical protein AeRB84_010770 [Aphanomyces euteiches]
MVDYQGQKLADQLMNYIFALVCTPAWFYGWMQDDFTYPLYAWGIACVLVCLVVLPDWPFYNRNPVQWRSSLKKSKEE